VRFRVLRVLCVLFVVNSCARCVPNDTSLSHNTRPVLVDGGGLVPTV
jgi:hypothetical protein